MCENDINFHFTITPEPENDVEMTSGPSTIILGKSKVRNTKKINDEIKEKADMTMYTTEERLVAAVWVHERTYEDMTMRQIKLKFQNRFYKPPPTKNTLYDWEKKIFGSGMVIDSKRMGRPCMRMSLIPSVQASLQEFPSLSIRARAKKLSVSRATLKKVIDDIQFLPKKSQIKECMSTKKVKKIIPTITENHNSNEDCLLSQLLKNPENEHGVQSNVNLNENMIAKKNYGNNTKPKEPASYSYEKTFRKYLPKSITKSTESLHTGVNSDNEAQKSQLDQDLCFDYQIDPLASLNGHDYIQEKGKREIDRLPQYPNMKFEFR